MDYYSSSSSRGRGSYRGSYRGDSSRGSSRGSYSSRGRGSSQPSYKSSHESSASKYSSSHYDGGKYGSSSYGRADDYYSRRSEGSFGSREREHRSDLSELASRKRERNDTYSQGLHRRGDDEYRSSSKYGSSSVSSSYAESSRSYDDSRAFKKPRTDFKSDYKSELRVKEPLRPRVPRGRGRGSFSARRGRGDPIRFRSAFTTRRASSSTTASTSEILAIRRAKLLQKRLKEQNATNSGEKDKPEKKDEDTPAATPAESQAPESKSTDEVKEKPSVTTSGKPFIKLECPSCSIKCLTFNEYIRHLTEAVHIQSMKTKADELKATLAAMRIAQRELQKKMEEEDLTSMETSTKFCPVCKLNYSTDRGEHEASDLHKKLKKFLMPYCKVCRASFHSPLLYEKHLCSLDHIKIKHTMEEREKRTLSTPGVLERFMVLDSVGSGDEVDEKEDDKSKGASEDDLTLGIEFIHDVMGKFCEVCRDFLPRSKDYASVIRRHCRTKEHLRCYLHYGNEELLEKINADDGEKKEDKAGNGDIKDEQEEVMDESKLWDGFGELLDEAQGQSKFEDEEEEEEGGRFDRFKSNEKVENGEVLEKSEDGQEEAVEEPKAELITQITES